MEKKNLQIERIVEYSDIFNDESKPRLEDLIQGIDRKHLCILLSNMSSRLVGRPFFDNDFSIQNGEFDCMRFFLSKKDPNFFGHVYMKFLELVKQNRDNGFEGRFVASGMSTVMLFQRYVFALEPCLNKFSIHTEQNIFKAYLLLNEKVLKACFKQDKNNIPLDLSLAEMYLAYNYANEDVEATDYNDAFRRQFIKSICLFEYLFRDKRLKGIRKSFLSHYHLSGWFEYWAYHIHFLNCIKYKSGVLDFSENSRIPKKVKKFIKKMSISLNTILPYDKNSDYIFFRSKPFIQIGKNEFAITNVTFLIEHLYNSLYFDLKSNRKESGFISDDEFRSYWTSEFAQKYMFHRFVRGCLHGNELVVLDGCECDSIVQKNNLTGVNPPDFYIRTPDCCLLFEFKDTLLSAKIKDERNSEKFFKELEKKFVKNNEGKPKGIAQLMINAKAIQDNAFVFDKVRSDIPIIPVLVVDNLTYTMRGMRTKLEYMKKDYCVQNKIDTKTICPLILVDVATFRLHQDYIANKGFYKVFSEYYAETLFSSNMDFESIMYTMNSFTEYMKAKPISNLDSVIERIVTYNKSYFS